MLVAGLALLPGCSHMGIGGYTFGTNLGLRDYPGHNATATKAYLASLDFSQTDSIVDTTIPCHDAADCTGPSVHLRIVPERNAYKVHVDDALKSGRGYIVARIENKSPSLYKSLNLAPNETAYLWVGAVPSGPRRIAIFNIKADNGHATLRSYAQQAGWCADPAAANRTISAVHLNAMPQCVQRNNFYSSPIQGIGLTSIRLASTSSSILADATTKLLAHTSGLWFSCSLGCCEGTSFFAVL